MNVNNPNPLQASLDKLFERLNIINGMLFHLNSQLRNFRDMLTQRIQEQGFDINLIVAGASLVIEDLNGPTEEGWPYSYSTGTFVRQGEEYISMVEVLVKREATWTTSQGFEAFETFLYDIISEYLLQFPQAIEPAKWSRYNQAFPQNNLQTFDDVRTYIKWTYKQNKDLLNYMGRIANQLGTVEVQNNKGINLRDWYKAATLARHAITHSDMKIPADKLQQVSPAFRNILEVAFPGEYLNDGSYTVSMTVIATRKVLELFAEYAYTIFKALSIQQNLNWEIFPSQREDNQRLNNDPN